MGWNFVFADLAGGKSWEGGREKISGRKSGVDGFVKGGWTNKETGGTEEGKWVEW